MADDQEGLEFPASVSAKLQEIFTSGVVAETEIDKRVLQLLIRNSENECLQILDEFSKNVSEIPNKGAFLCKMIETHLVEKLSKENVSEEKEQSSIISKNSPKDEITDNSSHQNSALQLESSNDPISKLLERTGYSLTVTPGQRRYGGPPPNWEGQPPGASEKNSPCQVYIGKIPSDVYEDVMVPLIEECGQIYELRLMTDPQTGSTKGFGFCTFYDSDQATEFAKKYDGHFLNSNKLVVTISNPNRRLFISGFPRSKTKDQLHEELTMVLNGITEIVVHQSQDDSRKNRGFLFAEFDTHENASIARRKILNGHVRIFNGVVPRADWADPILEPDENAMQQVKSLFVRNVPEDFTEDRLKEIFSPFGDILSIKKQKSYVFVNYALREAAVKALETINDQEFDGKKLEISFAKPTTSDAKRNAKQRFADRLPPNMPYSGRMQFPDVNNRPYDNRGFGQYNPYNYSAGSSQFIPSTYPGASQPWTSPSNQYPNSYNISSHNRGYVNQRQVLDYNQRPPKQGSYPIKRVVSADQPEGYTPVQPKMEYQSWRQPQVYGDYYQAEQQPAWNPSISTEAYPAQPYETASPANRYNTQMPNSGYQARNFVSGSYNTGYSDPNSTYQYPTTQGTRNLPRNPNDSYHM